MRQVNAERGAGGRHCRKVRGLGQVEFPGLHPASEDAEGHRTEHQPRPVRILRIPHGHIVRTPGQFNAVPTDV